MHMGNMGCGPMFKGIVGLSIGYLLCVVAKKQAGILKTIGYVLGVVILAASLIWSIFMADARWGLKEKAKCMGGAEKPSPTMKK